MRVVEKEGILIKNQEARLAITVEKQVIMLEIADRTDVYFPYLARDDSSPS